MCSQKITTTTTKKNHPSVSLARKRISLPFLVKRDKPEHISQSDDDDKQTNEMKWNEMNIERINKQNPPMNTHEMTHRMKIDCPDG